MAGLRRLLKNIKGTVGDSEVDQVIATAATVYAVEHRDASAGASLGAQLSCPHRRVLVYITCQSLELAFRAAAEGGRPGDLLLVMSEAAQAGDRKVEGMCRAALPP
mmetsp:Transcript_54399/g.172843  ORF Transcript_54399/g.172843 Transcript_54399/m.172843 type:complete len:106 (-) Transcript_54399:224-541(-)